MNIRDTIFTAEIYQFGSVLGLSPSDIELILQCESIGMVEHYAEPKMLTYAESQGYFEKALDNPNVYCIVCPVSEIKANGSNVISVHEPKKVFWSLVEFFNRTRPGPTTPTILRENVKIKPGAFVADLGCVIGSGTVIEEGAVILPGTTIGDNCKVGPGTVISSEGFEVKDTFFGRVRITHDAGVQIGNNVSLGASCTVNRGFFGRNTIIESNVNIDSGVHIAHSCSIGERNTIAANVTFGGSVQTGCDVFIGLNATLVNGIKIGSGAFVGAGTVVVRELGAKMKLVPYPSKTFSLPI